MPTNRETQPSQEKKGRFLSAWKKFNTVSAAVLASAGVIFEQPILLGLAAIDVIQSVAIGKFEKWRARRKTGQAMGGTALRAARA